MLLNKFSSKITSPKSQGASQAMLHATGLSEEDLKKPQVGIASVWFEGNPCNMHLLQLAEKAKGVSAEAREGKRLFRLGAIGRPERSQQTGHLDGMQPQPPA